MTQGPLHEVFGLACGLSLEPSMSRAHRHDDVEVILALNGAAVLEHASGRHVLQDRSCAVFWAGRPHRVVEHEQGMSVAWATVPLAEVLAWDMPPALIAGLLPGGIITLQAPAGLEVGMQSWQAEIGTAALLTAAVRLELHALLLRAQAMGGMSAPTSEGTVSTALASFIALNFHRPVTVAEIAASVHLHPSTASAVFRRDLGITIGEYLAQCRVAEAQRLLISSDATTSDIALRAGFGSTTRFYERFTRDTGMPPGAYRKRMR